MERPKLSGETAEQIINLLRDNPGVSMTLSEIADETGLPVDDLAAFLDELATHNRVIHDVTPDEVDVWSFPDEYQRGTTDNDG